MSEWRDIWKDSLIAQKNLMTKNDFSYFDTLLKGNPGDGMIYYVLGETFEKLNELKKSQEYYSKARQYFPVSHWKEVADLGITRVTSKIQTNQFRPMDDFYSQQWFYFHQLHSFVYLPDEARYISISAISKIDSEKETSVASLRTSLEIALKELLDETAFSSNKDDYLVKLIDGYCKKYPGGAHIKSNMDSIRFHGNKATHHNDFDSSNENLILIMTNFYKIMKVLNKNLKEINTYIED